MAVQEGRWPEGNLKVLPVGVWAAAPMGLVVVVLWAAGQISSGVALAMAAAAGLAAWLVGWCHDRHLQRFARYADSLARDGLEDAGAVPDSQSLPAALGNLARRLETERERGAGQASAADAMLDSLPDPVLLLDSSRHVLRANAAAAELLGRAATGQDLALSLRHPAVLEAVDSALNGDTPGGALEIVLPGPGAREFSVRVVALPRTSIAAWAAVLTLHDLTAIRRAEQMRADFVANASHELRTPLATLIGFIETLQGPARDDAEARERFLAIMSEQAGRMARLIRDLLSLSQIEMNEHTPPRGSVDLGQVLRGVSDMLQIEAQKTGVALTLDVGTGLPAVTGDADQLTQVFQNLVDNAIKYGRRNSTVTIAARVSRTEGRPPAVAVAITDQGAGIAREFLPRLTERFYRVDSARSRALGGTGLGLAIVKHIVNRHRGSLTIDSVVGQGTTFTVFLPAVA